MIVKDIGSLGHQKAPNIHPEITWYDEVSYLYILFVSRYRQEV